MPEPTPEEDLLETIDELYGAARSAVLDAARAWRIVSPPKLIGTTSTGITGDQETTHRFAVLLEERFPPQSWSPACPAE